MVEIGVIHNKGKFLRRPSCKIMQVLSVTQNGNPGGIEMSLCGVCHLDIKKHSKKLWTLHQQTQTCMFCQKKGSEHSEKLWEMHKLAAENGRYCPKHHKEEKLYPLTVGFARTGIARVCKLREWNDKLKMHITADPPYDKELIPIYMSCAECSIYLGSIEEDNADILDGMCMNCFREQTETDRHLV